MDSSQLQSSQGFIVEVNGDADGTRTYGIDLVRRAMGCLRQCPTNNVNTRTDELYH